MYFKSAIILTWLVASYVLLVFWAAGPVSATALALSLSLAVAGAGFCIQHDGSHGAYSNRRFINWLAGYALDVLGASSYMWRVKHVMRHHGYTNIVDRDSDIDVGYLCRLAPQQRRFRAHRYQHIYMWLFYSFLAVKWHLYDDFAALATGRLSRRRYAYPSAVSLLALIAGKVIFAFIAFGLPLYFHPVWKVVTLYALVTFSVGMTLTVVFVLAHLVSEAQFAAPGDTLNEWTIHQVQTTVDFARNNRLLNWYLGGLNFQVEHHLFPNICHVHYREISNIIQKTCEEHGVQYKAHDTMWAALRSHYRWLREMGRAHQTAG